MNIAIVTGASSGLGLEYVRQISAKSTVDEIWVIARREERLQQISAMVSTPLRAMVLDLTKEQDIENLQQALKYESPNVKLLINNAGFGKMGNYSQIPEQDVRDLIDLNCRASVEVTNAVLPYMHKGGNILIVSSSSAFHPVPGLNVYAASKAFLLSYSRGLRFELFDREINVTAVCPYWIKDTEFIHIAKHSRNSSAIRSFPLAGNKRNVVTQSLFDTYHGLAVSTPGLVSTLQRAAGKILPNCVTIGIWELLRRI